LIDKGTSYNLTTQRANRFGRRADCAHRADSPSRAIYSQYVKELFFSNEPILEISAPIAEAQFIETLVLNERAILPFS
jgi:hypothetical protein